MTSAFKLPPLSDMKGEEQKGINMVDLMMWLVIAALLLAAAIQGIGYYQKAAVIHQMQNDLSGAGSNVMAVVANTKGVIDKTAADEGVLNTKFSKEVTPFVEVVDGDTIPYLRATHPGVSDTDVIYLFKDCLPLKVGVNTVPKAGSSLLTGCGIAPSPSPSGTPTTPSTGTPTTPPATPPATATPTAPPTTAPPTTPPVVPVSMVSEWDTSIVPSSEVVSGAACTVVQLPISGTVNATIDWGDGTKEAVTTSFPQHTYTGTQGLKTVSIAGTFTNWVGGNTPWDKIWSAECLTKVTQWDDASGTTDARWGFEGANHLTEVVRVPSTVTDFWWLFANASAFNGDISGWDVSNVTRMEAMFQNATSFNKPIGNWNVSKVTNTVWMFDGASSFNQPLSNWNVSNVVEMSGMFSNAYAFNQPIGNWDVSHVQGMNSLFMGTPFNQDISNWNTSSVVDMGSMFSRGSEFNGDISRWNTSNVLYMGSMFRDNYYFSGDISNWNTSKVTQMDYMFQFTTAFNSDISRWDTSSVTQMMQMFDRSTAFNRDLKGWNVSLVDTSADYFKYYFNYASALTDANMPLFP